MALTGLEFGVGLVSSAALPAALGASCWAVARPHPRPDHRPPRRRGTVRLPDGPGVPVGLHLVARPPAPRGLARRGDEPPVPTRRAGHHRPGAHPPGHGAPRVLLALWAVRAWRAPRDDPRRADRAGLTATAVAAGAASAAWPVTVALMTGIPAPSPTRCRPGSRPAACAAGGSPGSGSWSAPCAATALVVVTVAYVLVRARRHGRDRPPDGLWSWGAVYLSYVVLTTTIGTSALRYALLTLVPTEPVRRALTSALGRRPRAAVAAAAVVVLAVELAGQAWWVRSIFVISAARGSRREFAASSRSGSPSRSSFSRVSSPRALAGSGAGPPWGWRRRSRWPSGVAAGGACRGLGLDGAHLPGLLALALVTALGAAEARTVHHRAAPPRGAGVGLGHAWSPRRRSWPVRSVSAPSWAAPSELPMRGPDRRHDLPRRDGRLAGPTRFGVGRRRQRLRATSVSGRLARRDGLGLREQRRRRGGGLPRVLLVATTIVWPLSMLLLARTVLGPSPAVGATAVAGAFLFYGMPYQFLTWGVVWPNLLSLAVLPAALACLCRVADSLGAGSWVLTSAESVLLVAVAAAALLAHPSAAYSLLLLGTPLPGPVAAPRAGRRALSLVALVSGWSRRCSPGRSRPRQRSRRPVPSTPRTGPSTSSRWFCRGSPPAPSPPRRARGRWWWAAWRRRGPASAGSSGVWRLPRRWRWPRWRYPTTLPWCSPGLGTAT